MSFKIIFMIELYVKCYYIYTECVQINIYIYIYTQMYIYILTIILKMMFKISFKE